MKNLFDLTMTVYMSLASKTGNTAMKWKKKTV